MCLVTFLVIGGQGESMSQYSTLEASGKVSWPPYKGEWICWGNIASSHHKDEVNFQTTLTACLKNSRWGPVDSQILLAMLKTESTTIWNLPLDHMQSGPQRWPFNESFLPPKGQCGQLLFAGNLVLIIAITEKGLVSTPFWDVLPARIQGGIYYIWELFLRTHSGPTHFTWMEFHLQNDSGTRLRDLKSLSRTHTPKRNNS